jgi:single-strand DNA-binding protein
MASINKVILIGHLGRDPERRSTPGGSAVCNVTLATSRHWKSKDSGDKVEETEWHRVVFFDRLAEIAGEYLRKGRPVYVEGRLKTRKWQDKDGRDTYATEVIAENLQLLGGREAPGGEESGSARPAEGGRSGFDEGRGQGGRAQPARRPAATQPSAARPATGFDDRDDDIPF